jgi:predicted O-methyltransferase YrrM
MKSKIYSFVYTIRYLFITYASYDVIFRFISDRFIKSRLLRTYESDYLSFLEKIGKLNLNSNWYAGNYFYWYSLFDKKMFYEQNRLLVLEIGSWEGLSSFFILENLPKATLTCVDTWGGSDEQNASEEETNEVLQKTESNFDKNMEAFGERLIKIKSTSFDYFNKYKYRNQYDLIYVDGSHHCDDVIVDGVKCFEQLKIGGYMIFDDYLWRHYPSHLDNPASAINCLLNTKRGSFKVISVYEQIIIQKLSDRYN